MNKQLFSVPSNELQQLIAEAVTNSICYLGQVQTIPAPDIINRRELCRRLAISEPTAIRWQKKGKIPGFRIGSNVRYNWPTVLDKLEGKSKGGAR